MGIEASHWGMILANVERHAHELYPSDPVKARKLKNHLLALPDEDDSVSVSREADQSVKYLEASVKKAQSQGLPWRWFGWLFW